MGMIIIVSIVAAVPAFLIVALVLIPRHIRAKAYGPLLTFLDGVGSKVPDTAPTTVWKARLSAFAPQRVSVSPLTILEYPDTIVLRAPSVFRATLPDLPIPTEFVTRHDDYVIVDFPASANLPADSGIFISRDPGLRPERIWDRLAGSSVTEYETESRKWQFRCPKCNRTVNLWLAGCIRYKAAGNPRKLRFCPKCDRSTWHITERTP